jgi:hypothetical protein
LTAAELWPTGSLAGALLFLALFDVAALLGSVDSDTGSWALAALVSSRRSES